VCSPLGRHLIERRNFFVETILPRGVRRRRLSDDEMNAYRGPFPNAESPRPFAVFPREILGSRTSLAETAAALPALCDRPALVWPTKDFAFREPERKRWEALVPGHHTVLLEGAGHYMQEDAAADIVAATTDFVPR
jgi:haloalkane dehalogenase